MHALLWEGGLNDDMLYCKVVRDAQNGSGKWTAPKHDSENVHSGRL